MKPNEIEINKLERLTDKELLQLKFNLHNELKRRNLPYTAGAFAEKLVIDYFNSTPGCPNLQEAPPNTANVDALSRRGERYSIKSIVRGRKTGTIYPDRDNEDKQLFEYLLIVRMDEDWELKAIFEMTWNEFRELRSWDKRMNAWYVSGAMSKLSQVKVYLPNSTG